MKYKFFVVLSFVFLVPFFVHASFDPTAWLRAIKITTYTKPKPAPIATSSTTTVGSLLGGVINRLSPDREKILNDQISQLKSENDSLKKTIVVMQQKITLLTTQQQVYLKTIDTMTVVNTPETLAKIKSLEWTISGFMDNNYRYKIDENGLMTIEKQLNINFFKEGQGAVDFVKAIKSYDELAGTTLYQKFQNFLAVADDVAPSKFKELYDYFLSVRKFQK